jgi:hypothetical protein
LSVDGRKDAPKHKLAAQSTWRGNPLAAREMTHADEIPE